MFDSCKKEELPILSTSSVSNITGTSASSGGNITSDGGAEITARGVCWDLTSEPTVSDSKTIDGVGIGQFVSTLNGLNGGSTYHIRAYGTNSVGTAYGEEITFSTEGQAPSATTQPATNVTGTSVTLNGIINTNYLATTVAFDYGMTEAYGNTIIVALGNITDNASINVTAILSGLNSGTLYHFRIRAENDLGTTYGSDFAFTTLVIDMDGNIYKIVTIGTQVWMAENLKTTKYSNGDEIPDEIEGTEWLNLKTGAYCWYNNSENTYKNTFGALYNWYAVHDSRNLCPTGWHIPSENEWAILTTYLGGESVAGGKLKETGTNHWQSPNTGATNETGFSALAGGYRYYEMMGGIELFYGFGSYGCWWAITDYSSEFAWYQTLSYNSNDAFQSNDWKSNGFSVRCLRDN